MSNEAEREFVSEAECSVCRDLDPDERLAMRADLIQIPLREPICERCMEAFWTNLCAGLPKTEEERLQRQAERAARGMSENVPIQRGVRVSLLSKLFGKRDSPAKGTHLDPEVEKIFEKVERLLQDDETQLELVSPEMSEVLKRAPYYDKDPNGTGPFGLCKTNPIPVNGPVGELAYLSKILTNRRERILFHRVGAVDKVDIFETVTFSGGQWFIFFLDMYHPKKSQLAPDGFKLSSKACQFSGFNQFCADFPYDFMEMRHQGWKALGPAYMPTGDIIQNIRAGAYERPTAHKARLELLGIGMSRRDG